MTTAPAADRFSPVAGESAAPLTLALPKGRGLPPALAAFRAAGLPLAGLDEKERRLAVDLPEEGVQVLLLKNQDLPLYVEHGVADLGVVGSDVLDELGSDLLTPVRFLEGRCRLSLVGRPGALPAPGSQVRLATKFPKTARRIVAERSWGAEVVELSGSIELAPLLDLAELALDIVQTGRTLAANGLVELERVVEVAPCLVVNRASFLERRATINRLVRRLEEAGVAE